MNVRIDTATQDEVRSGFVGRQLREFNYGFVGKYPEQKLIHLNARIDDGEVIGGLRSFVLLGWLRVEVLWVHESLRGHGLGSKLLGEAEARAIALGARNSALETFEWQAPQFYAKQGYVETSRIEKYAGDYFLSLMQKAL